MPNDTDFELDGSRVFKFTRKGYTFPQDVSALRLSFSVFNLFNGGFHFLKAKDDYEDMVQYIDGSEMFTFTALDSVADSMYLFNDYIDENSSFCVRAKLNPSIIKSLIRGSSGSFV